MIYEIGSAYGTYSTGEISGMFISSATITTTTNSYSSTLFGDVEIRMNYETGESIFVSFDQTNVDGIIELDTYEVTAPNGELLDKIRGFLLKEVNLNELLENLSEENFMNDFFSGDDSIYSDAPGTIRGYAGDDRIYGSYGNDEIFGGDGNDLIFAKPGFDIVYGGSGIDTFEYRLNSFKDLDLDKIEGGYQVSIDFSYAENFFYDADLLYDIERIKMSDGTLALDIDAGDTAGQAYRLYQAAFARTPDMPGVAYHMNDMESNGLSVTQIAGNFIASPEFKTQYGENPTEDEYVNLLYQNVLGRTPQQFEVDYYKDRFDQGTTDWNTTLVFFAESPENITLVGPDIANGIWLPDA